MLKYIFVFILFITSVNASEINYYDIAIKECKLMKKSEEEKKIPINYDNIFEREVPIIKENIACLKKYIKQATFKNLGEPHWENIEKQINIIETNYIELYKTVRCKAWPSCLNSGQVLPYIDYYTFLDKLLWDITHPN